MPRARFPVLAAALVVCCLPTAEAKKDRFHIEPGPTRILPEEAAIVAEPDRGIEHAVILAEETDWREEILGGTTVRYHRRIKILSSEARSLADVEIPASLHEPRLKEWWARTLLPDGDVVELPAEALERQTLAETRRFEVSTLRAALPAVEPGCVIDYGYEVLLDTPITDRVVMLQREWPVRELRFRWQPDIRLTGSFLVNRAEGLDIGYTREGRSIILTANDLPPVPEEPYMPPARELRASATFYYPSQVFKEPDRYWESIAKRVDKGTERFIADERATREALEGMQIPDGTDLAGRLRLVYDWINHEIEIGRLRTAEQIELEEEDDDEKARDHNSWVLERREARGWQPDRLFIGFARELGAEAELVLVMDRDFKYWWPSLLDWSQFEDAVVAVRLPGEDWHFVDPGSGLPYGEISWWYTGVASARVTRDGLQRVVIPLPDGRRNVTHSAGRLEFDEDNSVVRASWSRDYAPQAGVLHRRWLRRNDPGDREDRLYRLCGESNDVEVLSARAPGLDEQTAELRVECDCEIVIDPPDAKVGTYFWGLAGAWNPSLPELPPRRRRHPVILDYPRVDVTEVEILAPRGFEPVDPPATRRLTSPFGKYLLEFERIDGGYRVKRSVALVQLGVDPSDYDSLVEFLTEIRRADESSVEFRRTGR